MKIELVKSVTAESVRALLLRLFDICIDASCVNTFAAYCDAVDEIMDITGDEMYAIAKMMEGE